MIFHEVRFPDDISYGSSGGPQFSTDIIVTASGAEQRNINWQEARAKYNVAYGVKTAEQLNVLIAFFRSRKGRAHGFRFKDWTDYAVTAQQIGVGNGSVNEFQLVKTYASGAQNMVREIKKPVNGTVAVYKNGVLQTSGYDVDYELAVIIFDVPPAAAVVVTADFEFDVPVRFDTDFLPATLDSYGFGSVTDIPLLEIRVS